MVETILKCTILFVENEGNCVWVFLFSKPDICINSLYTVVAEPVGQRTTATHTQVSKGASELH